MKDMEKLLAAGVVVIALGVLLLLAMLAVVALVVGLLGYVGVMVTRHVLEGRRARRAASLPG